MKHWLANRGPKVEKQSLNAPPALQIATVCLLSYFCHLISEKREKSAEASEETQTSRPVSLHYLVFIVAAILFSRTAWTGTLH
jgi:hypothetical protein